MMGCIRHNTRWLLLLAIVLTIPQSVRADGVQWSGDLNLARRLASEHGRLLLIKFTADWCGYCKKMERTTFANPPTAELVNGGFVPVLIDADEHGELLQHFSIGGLPALLITTPDLQVVERISGFHTPEKLTPLLQAAIARYPVPRSTPRVEFADESLSGRATFDAPPQRDSAGADGKSDSGQASRSRPASKQAPDLPSFGGHCLTSVVESRSLVKGSSSASMIYRGQTLWFRDAEQRNTFRRSPRKYWPMLDGICGMTLIESGRRLPGKLEHAAVFRKRVWLFRTPEQLAAFVESPARYVSRFEAADSKD